MIVVADTGPINYLILSGHIRCVRELFGSLLIPPAVQRELLHPRAPVAVRTWAASLPDWAQVRAPGEVARFRELGDGEREAIVLALEQKADFVLMDETHGRQIAVQHGVAVKGTLGVLEDAAANRLIELGEAITKLKATNIFITEEILQAALERNRSMQEQPRQQPRNLDRER